MMRVLAGLVLCGLWVSLARGQPVAQADAGHAPASVGGGSVVPAPTVPLQAPQVTAEVSPRKVQLGRTFYLFVHVVHPPGEEVNLPASLPLGQAFEETARTDSETKNSDGTVTRDFEVGLMAFEVGDLVVPPIPVTYAARGRAQQIQTEPVSIQVVGVIGGKKANLKDIAGPVRAYRQDLTLLWVAGTVAGAILLAMLFLLVRRRWRRRRSRVLARLPEAMRRSAHEEALARLTEVEASGALDADDRKPAYLEMSEILRAYIGRRFGFPALDLTTGEIRRELEARSEGAGSAELVCGWLEHSDMVKFAGYDASPDEARQSLYEARIFIDRTRPSAPAAEGGAAEQPPAQGAA